MINRRGLMLATAGAVVTPYFFFRSTVRADTLTDGIVKSIKRVSDNLAMVPAGRQNGTDIPISGGGTVFGRSVRGQAADMAQNGNFTKIYQNHQYTENVVANNFGYMFARFRSDYRNCCLPLGLVSSQNTTAAYRGAMTLVEGPNFVALRVLTDLLVERNYSSSQIRDLVWPITPSIGSANRARALLFFDEILRVDGHLQDRDVLNATKAKCVLQYTSQPGSNKPDGGGRGALVVNGVEQFRFEFQFDTDILKA